jgi:hypothetical protein
MTTTIFLQINNGNIVLYQIVGEKEHVLSAVSIFVNWVLQSTNSINLRYTNEPIKKEYESFSSSYIIKADSYINLMNILSQIGEQSLLTTESD